MSHEADPRSAIRREWDAIAKLALSFDGYEHAGSFDACADIDGVAEQVWTAVSERLAPDRRRA